MTDNHLYDFVTETIGAWTAVPKGIWLDVNSDANTFRRNRIHDVPGPGIFVESRCDENEMRENICYRCARGGFDTAGYGVGAARGNRWINNVAYANGYSGFSFRQSSGNVVKNNIAMNNAAAEVYVSDWAVTEGGNVFLNNLWYKSGSALVATWNDADRKHYKPAKLTLAQWIVASGETGALSVDPLFADPASGDFHLGAASPARRAGEGGVDMGAYPGAAGGPAAPTGLVVRAR
ncbi:MAG: right-handed parallel beta-helix repeat-containing protein [Kiritimatiellae bacterium]|nr:right-handed parallel beta-helix repeat-containing protein [Kiritimatiellia bacterium]